MAKRSDLSRTLMWRTLSAAVHALQVTAGATGRASSIDTVLLNFAHAQM